LRLSLTKAAYAVASGAAYRKSGFSAGDPQSRLRENRTIDSQSTDIIELA
jgi:hypothetical protein